MIQMGNSSELRIPMSSCRDMKVSLDFVPFQTPVNATRVRLFPPSQFGRLRELPPPFSHMPQHMAHMLVFSLGFLPLAVLFMQSFVGASTPALLVHVLVGPHLPVRVVSFQHVTRKDPIHGRILYVDVEVSAMHSYHYIQVDLQFMADAPFDTEMVGLGT